MKPKRRPPDPNLEPWRCRLREARIAAGLNQTALARLVGKSQTSIGDYENANGCEPNLALFEKIAAATGVTAAWLIFGYEGAPMRIGRPPSGLPPSAAGDGTPPKADGSDGNSAARAS